jgi:hypothetical protein
MSEIISKTRGRISQINPLNKAHSLNLFKSLKPARKTLSEIQNKDLNNNNNLYHEFKKNEKVTSLKIDLLYKSDNEIERLQDLFQKNVNEQEEIIINGILSDNLFDEDCNFSKTGFVPQRIDLDEEWEKSVIECMPTWNEIEEKIKKRMGAQNFLLIAEKKMYVSNLEVTCTTLERVPETHYNEELSEKPVKIEKPIARRNSKLVATPRPSLRKTRLSTSRTTNPRIMATFKLNKRQMTIIENLGGLIVTDCKETTHLITEKIEINCKFLSCLNKGAFIVNENWLDQSNDAKTFLKTTNFIVSDLQTEKQYQFNLLTTLNKTKSSAILKNWNFILMPQINDILSFSDLKVVIECGEGEVINELPTEVSCLTDCCIIYSDNVQKSQDESCYAAIDILKITLSEFISATLHQNFDSRFLTKKKSLF